MINSINLLIPGKPTGKQRSRKGAYGNWYNPQAKEMRAAKLLIQRQLPDRFTIIPAGVPVIVNVAWFFMPALSQQTKKFMAGIETEMFPFCKKIDVDNATKYALDILSKIVFHDDNQVYGGSFFKYYTPDNPRTEIEVLW